MSTIGFIGLGNMGQPMARHLLSAGHRLRVFARKPAAAAALVARGAVAFSSPADAAAGADFTCINVTSTSDVQAVLFGERGIEQGARSGSVVIDFSTISPTSTRTFATRLARNNIHYLDCPVSGGVQGANAAALTMMVGGKAEVLELARPVLQRVAKNIVHIGDHGAGQVAKACNQIVQVITIQGIAEAIHFARAQGVDLDRTLTAMQHSMAGSKMLDLMGPKMVSREYSAGIEARLHEKDFGLVVDQLEALGLDLPAVLLVSGQLHDLVQRGWGHEDTSALLKLLEAQSE